MQNLCYIGCKVPVMLYFGNKALSSEQIDKLLQMQRKYPMLKYTDKILEVHRFCRIEKL